MASSQRFTSLNRCPICSGYAGLPRRKGERCEGFYNADRSFANCCRPELAGDIEAKGEPPSYGHRLDGPCKCGQTHGASRATARVAEPETHFPGSFFKKCPDGYPVDYKRLDGSTVYRVARWALKDGAKSYGYFRPDGKGEWLKGLADGTPRVVLDLPDIRQEIADGRSIVLCEGEKKARAMRSLGFAATCNDGGALGFKLEHAECLRGAPRVYIITDNDRDGMKRGERVPPMLQDVPDVRVVNLPGLEEGQGVDDWLDEREAMPRGQAKAELERLMRSAPQWTPPEKHQEQPEPDASARSRVRRLSDVVSEPVTWLWPGRIPLGMLTVLDGDPGLGKSLLTIELAARVSCGREMPDGSQGPAASDVLLFSAEDDLARTIKPRLEAAGADCSRIRTLAVLDRDGEREPTIAADDLAEIERHAHGARLIVIDPLMAYLPADVNAHRDQDVRRALSMLKTLAERSGAAVLVVRHLNKGTGGNPLYRGGGSIGIIGAARAGLLLSPDPDDAEARVLAGMKENLAPKAASLKLRLVSEGETVRISWEGVSPHNAGTLLQAAGESGEDRTVMIEALDYLRDVLCAGAQVPMKEVRQDAPCGLRTLEAAKARLGVVSRRVDGAWVWSLPNTAKAPAESPSPKPLAALRPYTKPLPNGVLDTDLTQHRKAAEGLENSQHRKPLDGVPTEPRWGDGFKPLPVLESVGISMPHGWAMVDGHAEATAVVV